MVACLPVFLALILNCYGALLFREPKEGGEGPLMSCYIFMFATFILLWDQRLYPRSLRQLCLCGQVIIEFFVSDFLMENIMLDFWFPLETASMKALPKVAEYAEDWLSQGNWKADTLMDILKNEKSGFVVSYLVSLFFLISVLQATRAIDLRELEFGPKCFFNDIWFRATRFLRRTTRSISGKKRVKLPEESCSRGGNRQNAVEYYETDSADFCPDFCDF